MHLQVELTPAGGDSLTLPVHYNNLMQGLIYNLVKERMPQIHKQGYVGGERTFRLFVFSRLMGRVKEIRDGHITFHAPVKFKVGSPLKEFIEALAEAFLTVEEMRLGSTVIWTGALALTPLPDFSSGKARGRALSPITVYSTLQNAEGKKKTYYYHPQEKEFGQQVKANLLKKAAALGIEFPPEAQLELQPVNVRSNDLKVVYYKDTVVKGWMGQYVLSGEPQLLRLAFSAGIGAKNSQGFGMLEPVG
ncbi:MAG: CRISPR-associated endoribonuclease Cas6 [Clostridia bacterium]|nr:CRISPR-associated endoribonuclease Cas6 [Clostridia bacterium]